MYQDLYKQKLLSAGQAADLIKPGDVLMYATFLGRPVDFDNELAARADELTDVQVYCCGGMPAPIMQTSLMGREHFTCNNWFLVARIAKGMIRAICFTVPYNLANCRM